MDFDDFEDGAGFSVWRMMLDFDDFDGCAGF